MNILSWLNPIGTLVSGLFSLINNYIEHKKELAQQEQMVRLKAEEYKYRLLESDNQYNTAWSLENLKQTDVWLRRCSFWLVVAPLILGMLDPVGVKNYFEVVINPLPDWYKALLCSILCATWAIANFRGMWKK